MHGAGFGPCWGFLEARACTSAAKSPWERKGNYHDNKANQRCAPHQGILPRQVPSSQNCCPGTLPVSIYRPKETFRLLLLKILADNFDAAPSVAEYVAAMVFQLMTLEKRGLLGLAPSPESLVPQSTS